MMEYDKKVLRKLQLVQLEILHEIDKICKKNKLTYFMGAGTLLGAIKYNGFIPWDDDLDVYMPRSDYEKFKKICLKELDPKYYLHCDETDDKYWLPFMKIKKNNTLFAEKAINFLNTHKGIFVDVFPLDNAKKSDSLFQLIQAVIFKKINGLILAKVGIKDQRTDLIDKLLKIFKFIPLKVLKKIQKRIMIINRDEKSKYFVQLASRLSYRKKTIAKNKYFPCEEHKFEDGLFPIPKDYDYMLKKWYGDYSKTPPKDKRETHMPEEIIFELKKGE